MIVLKKAAPDDDFTPSAIIRCTGHCGSPACRRHNGGGEAPFYGAGDKCSCVVTEHVFQERKMNYCDEIVGAMTIRHREIQLLYRCTKCYNVRIWGIERIGEEAPRGMNGSASHDA